jgi:hypothetical protein
MDAAMNSNACINETAWNTIIRRRKMLACPLPACLEISDEKLWKLALKGLTKNTLHAILCPRAKIAQSVEHSTENAGVGGSIPPLGTLF